MNHSSLPTGPDIYEGTVKRIHDTLAEQLSDNNSILFRAFLDEENPKEFRDDIEIQLTLQNAFRDIWKTGGELATKFGFLGNPDDLKAANYSVEQELQVLSRQVFDIIQPSIVSIKDNKKSVAFSQEAINTILERLEREKHGLHDATYLIYGQENQTEKAALDRMIALLKQAPARLRSELKKANYPSTIIHDQFSEGKIFKAMETIVLTSAFGFMTYGWHGLAYNTIDSLTRNARNLGINGSVWENIMNHPTMLNVLTYSAGGLAATTIGYGLVRGTRIKREYLLKDAEESKKEKRK